MREAILHLSDDQLAAIGLGDLVAAAREAELLELTELVCHGPGGIIMFRVRDPIPEDEFGDFEAVEWWERLSSSDDGVTYLSKILAPELPEDFGPDELGIAHDVAGVREAGLDLAVIGFHEDIGEDVENASKAGLDVTLERLSAFDGTPTVLDNLTERQREVLETAYNKGYYEVPKQTTSGAVADELGLDSSTVAEHLQRAERNVLSALLEGR